MFAPLLLIFLPIFVASTPKTVKIGVQASWPTAPVALEASEFIAEADAAQFWTYAETLMSSEAAATEASALEAAPSMSSLRRSLFEYAMHIRQLSPRVEMMRQVALASIPSEALELDVFATVGCKRKHYATVKELQDALLAAAGSGGEEKAPSPPANVADHLHPSSQEDAPVTVYLYANLARGKASREWHSLLKRLATEGAVAYVWRHWIPEASLGQPVDMVGYGVELAIKKMEYKAVDDREIKGAAEEKAAGQDAAVDNTDVQGFLFGKLIETHPSLQSQLRNLRQDLIEEDEAASDAPLKVWELKGLGTQVLQRIMSAADPLRAMTDISGNLPAQAHSLVKTAVNSSLAQALATAEMYSQQFGGGNFISFNKQPIEVRGWVGGLVGGWTPLPACSLPPLSCLVNETRSKLGTSLSVCVCVCVCVC